MNPYSKAIMRHAVNKHAKINVWADYVTIKIGNTFLSFSEVGKYCDGFSIMNHRNNQNYRGTIVSHKWVINFISHHAIKSLSEIDMRSPQQVEHSTSFFSQESERKANYRLEDAKIITPTGTHSVCPHCDYIINHCTCNNR